MRFGRDLVIATNLEVFATDGERREERVGAPRVAPLGSERRALVWAEVAGRTGLVSSAAQETMSGRFGAVSLELALELRADQLHAVATLEWPDAGLDVTLTERRWTDAFKRDVTVGDAAFDARFVASGREPAQVEALLVAEVRAALLAFERVTLDDSGAQLASAGNGSTVEELEPFVRRAIAAATALDGALAAVPPPEALAAHRQAWAAQAQKLGASFCAVDFSIRAASYRGAPVELITRFDDLGAPIETKARVLLGTPHSGEALRGGAADLHVAVGGVRGAASLRRRRGSDVARAAGAAGSRRVALACVAAPRAGALIRDVASPLPDPLPRGERETGSRARGWS